MLNLSRLFKEPRSALDSIETVTLKPAEARSWAAPEIQRSASDHIFFAVRSIASDSRRHVLQYAFVDDRGNTVFTSMVGMPSPHGLGFQHTPEDMAVEPLDPLLFDTVVKRLCRGARIIAFGKVLQGGLLPVVGDGRSIDCAWRRFLEVSRQRRLAFDRSEPVSLSDALVMAGLEAPASDDAPQRAQALRRLWLWMDRVDLEMS